MERYSNLSIIIPARNEGDGIARIVANAIKYSDDVIVVDGHSQDQTKEIVEKLGVKFLLDNKKGKGDAMKVGVAHAKYENILFYDADGSHDPTDLPKMAEYILSSKADMITASRRTGGSFDLDMSFVGLIRSVGCDFLVVMINHRFKANLSDVLYSFRAIKKNVFEKLDIQENGFGVEQEMVIKCLANGFSIFETPSRELKREWGKSKLQTIVGIHFIFMIVKEYFKTYKKKPMLISDTETKQVDVGSSGI